MKHVAQLGPLHLSRVVAGAWRLANWQWSVEQRIRWIEGAIERGVTTFDHADIYGDYGGEALFGEALHAVKGLRERIELVTKCNIMLRSAQRPDHRVKHYDSSRQHIVRSVEASLKNLRTDRIDLLLLHRPDMLLDADEVASTFDALRAAGKVRAFGVSNFTASQFELLASRTELVTNQVELSLLSPTVLFDGTLDQCQRLRVRPMIWSPLGGGQLFTSDSELARRLRAELSVIARTLGVSEATLAYAWVLRHPAAPLAIVGSRRLEALDEAVRAQALELDRQSWYALLTAAIGREVP